MSLYVVLRMHRVSNSKVGSEGGREEGVYIMYSFTLGSLLIDIEYIKADTVTRNV